MLAHLHKEKKRKKEAKEESKKQNQTQFIIHVELSKLIVNERKAKEYKKDKSITKNKNKKCVKEEKDLLIHKITRDGQSFSK